MEKNIVGALVSAGLVLAAVAEDRLPSLESPCLHGAGGHISKLAALAGPDWRAVAEKNRKPELKYLSKAQIIALMQKYADKETGDVGGEPLDEMPEIAEASFRAGDFCFPYGIALWRHFFKPDVRTFLRRWSMEGPTHHFALGVGHHAAEIKKLGKALGIETVVVTEEK